MRRPGAAAIPWGTGLDSALNLALGLALVLAAVALAEHFRGARTELGRVQLASLSPELQQRLAHLDDRLFLTYYVSSRERMPSHMRRVEQAVTDLFAAMERFAPERVSSQIVDPDGNDELIAFAARRKVAPIRVRHVTRDSFSEQEVWSTITLSLGPSAPARIDGVGPEHLPRLQALIVAHLDQLRSPRQPRIALAAPSAGFSELRGALEELGQVVVVDLAADELAAADADLLFWMDPGRVSPRTLSEIGRFLDKGRSVVVAGSVLDATTVLDQDGYTLQLSPSGFDAETLWGWLGLSPVDGLFLDEHQRQLTLADGRSVPAPFRIHCLANHQDFQKMAFEVNGNLLFEAPTPLAQDAETLAQRGFSAEILATTSDRTWSRPVQPSYRGAELPDKVGEARPKEALMVWLWPAEPWQGSVVACAASTPFRDGNISLPGAAHRRLLSVLDATLASPERLVMGRSGVAAPAPLPALDPGQRGLWRTFCALALPLVLLLVALLRSRGRRGHERRRLAESRHPDADDGAPVPRPGGGTPGRPAPASGRVPLDPGSRWLRALGWPGALGVLLLGCLAWLQGPRLDLTADGLNSLNPETVRLGREVGPLQVELLFSSPERLPPTLRPQVRRVGDLLSGLKGSGAQLTVSTLRPEDFSEDERQQWIDRGVVPFQLASQDEELTTVRTLWSALRLSAAGRSEVLSFPEVDSFQNLEFRLAFALWRLSTGNHPRLAFVSDTPRMSAAEAHEHFQTQGLIAPLGKDVYSSARELLSAVDFDLFHVDSRHPELAHDFDAMVWLQPRRPVGPVLSLLAEHLYSGGKALVAAQHFNMQARQFRGRGFDFVHWPQPQSNDLNIYYLPDLGIRLVRKVLFDELNLPITDQAQLNASERRDFRAMQSSLPFVIRAVGAHFDPDSPITRDLGDQAFIWPSAWEIDEQRLGDLGLAVRTLISTSEHSWSYDWSGGYLPPEGQPGLFEGPQPGPDGEPAYEGRQALMIDVRGTFPWPEHAFRPPERIGMPGLPGPLPEPTDAAPLVPPFPVAEPLDSAAPGRLVLIGDSELFKNERLVALRPEYRGDELLLNTVADLILPPQLSAVMARRPVARGFDAPVESERLGWRVLVLLAAPAAYLVLGLGRRLLRRAA